MVSEKIFISCAIALLLANIVYYSTLPDANTLVNNMFSGAISMVATAIIVIAVMSANILSVSLSDSFITMVIAITTMVNLFFRVNIAGFDLGFGLLTNIQILTNSGTLFGIGNIIITVLGLIMFVSAMMLINGGGN